MKRRSFSFALIFFGLFSFFQPPYRIDSQFHQYEDRYIRTRQSILLDATALFADEHRQNQQEAQKKEEIITIIIIIMIIKQNTIALQRSRWISKMADAPVMDGREPRDVEMKFYKKKKIIIKSNEKRVRRLHSKKLPPPKKKLQ